MALMSVALPLYNHGEIAWLVLESLVRQQNVPCEWELVIAEEQQGSFLGYDQAMSWASKLAQNGCSDIRYIALEERIPLSLKWRLLAQHASEESQVMVCVAGDTFPEPTRLVEAWAGIGILGADWVCSDRAPFYVVATGEVYLVDYTMVEAATPYGMRFSTKTCLARQLPEATVASGVDGWMFHTLAKLKAPKFNRLLVDNQNWTRGFDAHGFHNISNGRYMKLASRYLRADGLAQSWPTDVMARLQSMAGEAKL